MKDCELVVGAQGRKVSHSSWRRIVVRANATKKKLGSTHIVPYDAVLCILRRDPLEAAGLGGSNALHFIARGERRRDK